MTNKILTGLIIGLLIGLVVGGSASYFIFNNHRSNFPRDGNFQPNLSESQIKELTSFFNENHTPEEVSSYCEQNMMNCFYYCKNMNQSKEICGNMTNMPAGGRGWNQ
jgi:hypothetical protein